MTVSEWVRQSIDNIRRNGSDGVRRAGSDLAVGLKKRYWEYRKPGVDIYDLEWDLLVILDACRVDVLNEVSSEYDFLPDSVSSISSVGRLSEEWIDTTFSQASVGEVSETAYITGNPHTDRLLDPSDFTLLDEVWRYNWDDDIGTTPAPPLTDRTVSVMREEKPDRTIVHYMQPHFPFVPDPLTEGYQRNGPASDELWEMIRSGEVSRETVWERYRQNLEYVLNEVSILLENVDADHVAITADHGTAYGEYGLYGHGYNVPIQVVTEVPWCVTSATDTESFTPELDPETRSETQVDVNERLRRLGYLE